MIGSESLPYIVVVSGLPRSGTSLMMQMLTSGGLPPLTDTHRPPDASNPRGYLEYEPVKRLRSDAAWVPQARGHALKVIHMLLPHLPTDQQYRIIFMRRDLREVIASQRAMLQRTGRQGAALDEGQLEAAFRRQLAEVEQWLTRQPHIRLLDVEHQALIHRPEQTAAQVNGFLDHRLDPQAMTEVIDPALYRQRRAGGR